MGLFVFRLESVLRDRRREEERCQGGLGQARAELLALEARLREVREALGANALHVRHNHLSGSLDVAALEAHRWHASALRGDEAALRQKLAEQLRRVEEARAALTGAAKERKVLEKLRERQLGHWTIAHARRSRAEADEAGARAASAGANANAAGMAGDDAGPDAERR